MVDVITIGSATIDAFGTIGCRTEDYKLGDKVLVEKLVFEAGGGGINSAIALRRMGIDTAFLGKLGHDHNAFKLKHELKKEKVKIISTGASEEKTAFSFILKSRKEKDRVIFVHKGASDHLRYTDFRKFELDARWIYMATMLEESFRTCEKIAEYAKRKNIKLMFNPSSYLAKKGKKHLSKILSAATCLVLNRSEAKLLLKAKDDKIRKMMMSLSGLGPEIVVITEGNKGANAFDSKKLYRLPAYKVNVVNTAGAGDAFASGFLAGLLHKDDTVHALQMGMANSASVVQYYGCRNKLLTHRQAHSFIKKRKEKVIVQEL